MIPKMLEKDWQAKVVQLARLMGWRDYSARAAWTGKGFRTPVSSLGFPDLLLVRPPRLIAAELKTTSDVRPEQQDWLGLLGAIPCLEVFVWRPADWDVVLETLR